MGLYVCVFGVFEVAATISISPPRHWATCAATILRLLLFLSSCSRCVFVNGATPVKTALRMLVFVKFVPSNTAFVKSAPDKSTFFKLVRLSTARARLTRGPTIYASCTVPGDDA